MWFCLRTQQSDWLAVYRHQCKFHGKLSLCHFLFHQQSVFRVRSRKNSRREEKESAKKEATDKGYAVFVIICIACKLLSSVMYSRSLSALFQKSDTEKFREDMMY